MEVGGSGSCSRSFSSSMVVGPSKRGIGVVHIVIQCGGC
jgi:hypothetical protein